MRRALRELARICPGTRARDEMPSVHMHRAAAAHRHQEGEEHHDDRVHVNTSAESAGEYYE